MQESSILNYAGAKCDHTMVTSFNNALAAQQLQEVSNNRTLNNGPSAEHTHHKTKHKRGGAHLAPMICNDLA